MRKLRLWFSSLLTVAVVCSTAMAQRYAPTVRIVERIDESRMITLKGNTHPGANAKNDRGKVGDNLPMTDLILVLSRDPAQQAAFDKFVASQYDPASPNFHQWLTPEQVGENFGPAETDIATISQWLTGHGFSITDVSKDRMSIRFSGTASQVQSTFRTEIHNLDVKGNAHVANMSDPQIPAALASVVIGVKSLHNFFPRPLHRMGSLVRRDAATGRWMRLANSAAGSSAPSEAAAEVAKPKPQFGISVGGQYPYLVEDVGPWDFAAIYNVLPLWNAATPIDGTGQTIAIAGTSAIDLGQTDITGSNGNNDIATFRTFFGLPTTNAANTPIQISGNSQPLNVCTQSAGVCTSGDLEENTLDVEWSGAVAKNAQIILVASYPASATDDNLYDSESYIVNHLTARIMNVSYGECELSGTAENVKYRDLWQTAAAEGIAVFVSTGDSGAADCDQGEDLTYGTPYAAEFGLTVSGMASTPYNTAVGGTDFNWCPLDTALNSECSASPYWSTTNTTPAGTTNAMRSALGYVPEVPWNDTCSNPLTLKFLQDLANSYYGIPASQITNPEQACNFVVDYNYAGYVNGQPGLLSINPSLRNIVDTTGAGGGASSCVVSTSTATTTTCTSGATSTGAASGSIPLYNNGWIKPSWQAGVSGIPQDGVRDIPDVSFFAATGSASSSAYLICVSQASSCTYSNTSEPTYQEVGGTSVASPAMAGVMALINQKAGASQGSPNAGLYGLAAQQTYSSCSAESVTASSQCYFNDIDTGTIAMPCDASSHSPNCTASSKTFGYADVIGIQSGGAAGTGYDIATGLGSLNVANVVNAWPSATAGIAAAAVTVTPAQSSINSASSLGVTVAVAAGAGTGSTGKVLTPTGTVTLTVSGSSYSASATSSSGSYSFTIPANTLPGTASGQSDTLTATYSGDTIYGAASNTATVTVTGTVQATPTFTLTPSTPAAILKGGTATATVTVAAQGGYAGTVTLTCQLASSPSGATDAPTCSGGGSGSAVVLTSTATSGPVTFTVTTTAAKAALTRPALPGKNRNWAQAGGALLALLVFAGIPARRKYWRQMLGVLVLLAAFGSLSACGGGGGSSSSGGSTQTDPGTASGTYTFNVVSTATPSVTPAVSTTFTVTVN